MANPTGTNFFASVAMNTDPVTDAPYTWADGDVYEIAQTDYAEAAAFGATFNGLGVQNQAPSKLLNKVNLIRAAQLDDESNISGLETFKSAFAGLVGGAYGSGYIKIPYTDVNLGANVLLAQWGFYPWYGLRPSDVENVLFTFSFPIAFPNACSFMLASLVTNSVGGAGGLEFCALNLEPVGPSYGKGQGQVFSDYNSQSGAVITIASSPSSAGLTGFSWLAIGY